MIFMLLTLKGLDITYQMPNAMKMLLHLIALIELSSLEVICSFCHMKLLIVLVFVIIGMSALLSTLSSLLFRHLTHYLT